MKDPIEELRRLAGQGWRAETTRKQFHEIADEIEAQYMKLPVDADGVPIRVGDEIINKDGEKHSVQFVAPDGVMLASPSNLYYMGVAFIHYKPRAIMDVLSDFAAEVENGRNTFETARRYADEIRELLGGDA